MSLITTINSSDNISDSREDINTNFSNLNTDKLEASDITGKEDASNKKTTLDDDSDTFYPTQKAVKTAVDAKQDTLVSGTNIKTVNSTSLLGSGNIDISASSIEGTSVLSTGETGGTKFLREDGDGTCSWQVPSGAGDVVGGASSTDNAIARFDGETGKIIQNSGATVDDSGNIVANNIASGATVSGSNTGDQDLSGYVAKSTYDAHTILQATTDNTPAALTVGEQTVVGRATGGNITALSIDSDLSSVSANDDTIPSAKATKAALDGKLANVIEDTTPQLGGDLDLNEKNLIYDAIPSSDNSASGDIVDDITAGETLAFPNLVYLKSDGKWWKADADAIASCNLLGLALESKNADEAVKVLLRGFVRDDDWNWTVAGAIYASVTAGALSQTAVSGEDDVSVIVGWATHADRMYFNPDNTRIEFKA